MIDTSKPRPLMRLAQRFGSAALAFGMLAVPAAAAAAQNVQPTSASFTFGVSEHPERINVGAFPEADLVYAGPIMTMDDATTPNYLTTRNTLDRDIGVARTKPNDPEAIRLVGWADEIQLARQIKDPMAREQAVQDIAKYFFSYDDKKASAAKDRKGTEWENKPWDQPVQRIVEQDKGSVCQEFADLVTETGLRVNGNPRNVGVVTLSFVPLNADPMKAGDRHANGFANVDGRVIIHEQDGMYEAKAYFGSETAFQPGKIAQVESVETISAVNRYLPALATMGLPVKASGPMAKPFYVEATGDDAKIMEAIWQRDLQMVRQLVALDPVKPAVDATASRAFVTAAQTLSAARRTHTAPSGAAGRSARPNLLKR